MIRYSLEFGRLLLVDLFTKLTVDAGLPFQARGGEEPQWVIGHRSAFHVLADQIDSAPGVRFTASDSTRQAEIEPYVQAAIAKLAAGEYGPGVWYTSSLREVRPRPHAGNLLGGALLRMGGVRASGWCRWGGDCLIEFAEQVGEVPHNPDSPFPPQAFVSIHIRAPGPIAGHFSDRIAIRVLETIAALCGFALGRPLELPLGIFPSPGSLIDELSRRLLDPSMPALTRRGVRLDFPNISLDGREVVTKVQNAVITFDAARRQERDSVACVLYVVAAECLTVPNAAWKMERLTKRFVEFFNALVPLELDEIVSHDNFEGAFGLTRDARVDDALRRHVLKALYGYRSAQVHEGISAAFQGLGELGEGTMRRSLFSQFAEVAILGYIAAPRSSLWGHPAFEDECSKCGAPLARGPRTR